MTDRQIARRLDFWLRKLEPLGVKHFEFQICIPVNSETYPEISYAGIDYSHDYDYATLVIRDEHLDAIDRDELDRIIIHELIHLTMRDHDGTVLSVLFMLPEEAGELWQDRLDHEKEGIVERFAKVIQEAHK